MGRATLNTTVTVSLCANEVRILTFIGQKLLTQCKLCNSINDWENILNSLFNSNKINSRANVKVILGPGLYTCAQLPKNENLKDEELYSVAMYKDLEQVVTGQISDYTWDYYDAKTGKNSRPMLNFVLVEKKIISHIVAIFNDLATLKSITVHDMAMTSFVSFYQAYALKKDNLNKVGYVPQLAIMLYMTRDSDLMLYGVYSGELCYSRTLKGYKALALPGLVDGNDVLINRLSTEILRLSDDFFTSHLGLPQFTRLLLAIDSLNIEKIASVLSKQFTRTLEVIMSPVEHEVTPSFAVCDNEYIKGLAGENLFYLPLLGELMEGDILNEKNKNQSL